MVSCGAKHSLYNILQAVINPGDEVVIPAPYWVSYADMALLAGGVPKLIATDESTGFRITAGATPSRADAAHQGFSLEQSVQSHRRNLQPR